MTTRSTHRSTIPSGRCPVHHTENACRYTQSRLENGLSFVHRLLESSCRSCSMILQWQPFLRVYDSVDRHSVRLPVRHHSCTPVAHALHSARQMVGLLRVPRASTPLLRYYVPRRHSCSCRPQLSGYVFPWSFAGFHPPDGSPRFSRISLSTRGRPSTTPAPLHGCLRSSSLHRGYQTASGPLESLVARQLAYRGRIGFTCPYGSASSACLSGRLATTSVLRIPSPTSTRRSLSYHVAVYEQFAHGNAFPFFLLLD